MLWSRPFRGVPCASRALSLCAVCLALALSSGAQRPANDPPVIGEVFSSDAAVQGSVMLAGGGIQVLSGSSVSAGHGTATLKLKRGGEVRVCAGTTVSLSASATGKELLFGFSGGTIETRYSLPLASDTVLTPDFRVMLAGPGAFHFAIGSDAHGGTCVRALEASSASVIIHELMGNGVYQVKPGDDVYFPRGEVASAQSPAPATCGCPPPQRVLQRAESAPPSPMPAEAAAAGTNAATSATAAAPLLTAAPREPSTPVVTFFEPRRAPSAPTAGPPPAITTNAAPMPDVVGPQRRPLLEPVTSLSPSRPLPRAVVASPPPLLASRQPPPKVTVPTQAVRLLPVTELNAARLTQPVESAPPVVPSTQPVPAPLPPAPVAPEPVTTLSSARVSQPPAQVEPPAVKAESPSLPRMLPLAAETPALEPVTELPATRPLPHAHAAAPPELVQPADLPQVALPPRPVRTEPVTQLASSRVPEASAVEPPRLATSSTMPFPAPVAEVMLPPPPPTDGEVRFTVDAPMVFRAEDLPPASPTVTRADLRMPLPVIPPTVAPPPVPARPPTVQPAPAEAAKPQKKGFFSRIGGFFARLFGRGD